MRILHITDSHGTVKSPDSRTDLYYLTFLRKFAEITYLVKLYNIDMIIHTGDLFHTSRVSNKFMGQLAEIIKGYGVPMHVVPGNHDIDGYTIDTIDQTSLGLLAKTGVVTLLTRDYPLKVTAKTSSGEDFTVAISGQEYYKDIDTGNNADFEMQQSLADINVLACHSYIADSPQHPNIRCTYPKDIITDADIILTGHYHRQFEVNVGDVSIYNPGSMLRVEMTPYNKNHMPTYGILDISLDGHGDVVYDYKFHQFKIAQPSANVFDFNTNAIAKQHGITLENFKNSISNSMQSINANLGVTPYETLRNVVSSYINQNNITGAYSARLVGLTDKTYIDASQQVIDEDVISTKGFVPAVTPIYLEEVEMENFMSHEHTIVKFVPGLNIIIGESNTGKTTILRLIDWVVDNHPLGTDFIQTGKNYVKGVLKYSNGTIIERYRTLKDTGYYKVTFFDDISGQFITNEYKGFTNNVPVEVLNAHQMPKIAITKNIETHLNVMSQLERPFLLTENTNEKAAAIGRITGTNIIDKAIQNNTSEIAFNKKTLKALESDRLTIKSEMDSVPIKSIRKLHALYKQFKQDIDTLSNHIVSCENLKERSDIISGLVNQYQITVKQKEAVLTNKPTLELAEAKLNEVNQVLSLKTSYEARNNTIIMLQKDITSYETIIKDKTIYKSCDETVQKIRTLINLQRRIDNVNDVLKNKKVECDNYEKIITKKNTWLETEDAVAKITQLINLRNNINQVNQQISNMKNNIATQQSNIEELKRSLINTENEMKEFVLSSGKCPCCGQDITEANVADVIKNFSV